MPALSIIVAAHAPEARHFEEMLQSVLAQSFRDWEAIVTDDSSSSLVRTMCEQADDPRIRYLPHPHPLGAYGNHLAGFRAARGELIGVLNHDDRYAPRFADSLLGAAMREEADVVFCDHDVIDDSGKSMPMMADSLSEHWGRADLSQGLQSDFEALFVRQTIPGMTASIFHRRLLDRFEDLDAGPAYDVWLTSLFVRHRARVTYVPERLSAWRTHAGSVTSSGSLDWSRGAARVWQTSLAWLETEPARTAMQLKAHHAWTFHADRCLRSGFGEEARDSIRNALSLGSSSYARMIRLLAVAPAASGALLRAMQLAKAHFVPCPHGWMPNFPSSASKDVTL